MKTLGIVGGIGPESTIEYYRAIIAAWREHKRDGSYPPIILNSIDMKKMLDMIGAGQLAEVTEYLAGEVNRLARAGADFGLLAANTPHIVFGEIQRQSAIPLISIVEAACDEARARSIEKIGLLGTRFTMRGDFYPKIFEKQGIRIVVPGLDDQNYVHDKYMSEFVQGIFLDATRKRLLAIVDRMIERDGIQGLVLGGTELPLILRDASYREIPFFDTTKIHIDYAVAEMLI